MNKKGQLGRIMSGLIMCIGTIFLLGLVVDISTSNYYNLSNYSCEEIKNSLITTNYLVKNGNGKLGLIDTYYTLEEMKIHYEYRCNKD